MASRIVDETDRRSCSACCFNSWARLTGSQAWTTSPLESLVDVATGNPSLDYRSQSRWWWFAGSFVDEPGLVNLRERLGGSRENPGMDERQGRLPPPAGVKRQLRQEAGFGCCFCGLPIYQYHHIVPWAGDHHFRVDDMMLLCPLHHDQATKGALTEKQQRQAKANPRNIADGLATGRLTVNQGYLAVAVGTVLMVGDGPLIAVDGETLVQTTLGTDSNLLLSVRLFDSEDQLVAEVDANEWITGNPLPWDMESDYQVLRLRSAPYRISLDINAKGEPISLRGDLWRGQTRIRLSRTSIEIGNEEGPAMGISHLGLVGAGIDASTTHRHIQPLGDAAMLVSDPDPTRRLVKSVRALSRLRSGTSQIERGDSSD